MQYLEIIISFCIGALVLMLVAFVFSIKSKGIFRLLINTLAGGVALALLSVFQIAGFPLNPLNAFIVGILGAPGLILIYLVAIFL